MKEKFKKFVPNLILAVTASYMLLVFEPITLYSNNTNDFWFDLSLMLPLVLTSFFIVSVIVFTILSIIQKFSRGVYHFVIIIAFTLFFAAYIEGNYLAGFLPSFDGSAIDWSQFGTAKIISTIIWIVIAIAMFILTRKFTAKKVIKYSSYTTLAIFAMLSVSLLSTLLTTPAFERKNPNVTSYQDYHLTSKNKNFFIFLVDATEATSFEEENSKNPTYKETFANFTFFKDSLSAYPFTRDSIPLIFSGEWNENQTNFQTYSTNSFDNSKFLEKLSSSNYQINFYEQDLIWNSPKVLSTIKNIRTNAAISNKSYIEQIFRYLVFKYAPFPLKSLSDLKNVKIASKRADNNPENEAFYWDLSNNYKLIKNNDLKLTDDNIFKYIHVEGAHVPFDYDGDLNKITDDSGTYQIKLTATYTVIKAFIDRLKKNDVYDNSVIVIMADHGYNSKDYYNPLGRQNPLLMIKGINEKHDLKVSDKPISYIDLASAFNELMDGKKSTELFSDISYPRTRRYLFYRFSKENHMIEYETEKEAWKLDELKTTGKEFDLK